MRANECPETSSLMNNMTPDNADAIFNTLIHSNQLENTKTLLFEFISKLSTFENTPNFQLDKIIPRILSFVKNWENASSVYLYLLEVLNNKKDETMKLRILDAINNKEISISSLFDLLSKPDTSNLIIDILYAHESYIDEFIRLCAKSNDLSLAKNISQVFPKLPLRYFLNYKSFLMILSSESYNLRCSFLEIIENLIEYYKEDGNLDSIKELTNLLEERLNDVNFYVRSKALTAISNLFRKESILKDQRNIIISKIIDRARDKTVLVRKKAVNILGQVLMNYPFKDRRDLCRKQYNDETENKNNNESKKSNEKSVKTDMERDCNEFIDLMVQALSVITDLLSHNVKTDLLEISLFIKYAYLLKLDGSTESIKKIIRIIFTKDKNIIVDLFKELLLQRPEVVYEFINDSGFCEVLKNLDLNEKFFYKNFYEGKDVYKSSCILKELKGRISEDNASTLLIYSTNILFASKDENELKINIGIYQNTLSVLERIKNRIGYSHEILKLVNKNIIKMIFFERSIIKGTVRLIYMISQNPEKNIGKLMKNLCLSKSLMKIVDAIGWVAINEYYLLERLENGFKGKDNKGGLANIIANEEYKTFKKSIGDDELNDFRERRKSIEEGKRLSIGSRISFKLDELDESMKNKTDEEISDFFFYLKEKELLYSKQSILNQFTPLLMQSIRSENTEIQITAFNTLYKYMMVSSIFFTENRELLEESLRHPSPIIRNNAVIALHEFFILYNTAFDSAMLFSFLDDQLISKNVILVIYSLLHKNIIRIKNNSVKMIKHLEDEVIGSIVKSILKLVSSNNNIITTIFYEVFLSDLCEESITYLCPLINKNVQEPLFLKCLTSKMSVGRIKRVFEGFDISENFINENMYKEEMKLILEKKTIAE